MNLNINFASDEEIRRQALEAAPKPRKAQAPKRSEDPRFWKPSVENAAREYKALVRVLPRSADGRNGYCIRQDVHYIKETIGGKDVYLTVKCRKTLGEGEFCPICDANRKMYKTGQKHMQDKAKSRSSNTTYIGNFLILRDIARPEFDGKVKLWEHRKYMNDMIMAPITTGVELVKAQSFDAKPELSNFTPYNPITGHNLVVHMNVNQKNNIPSYENSYWETNASQFTDNDETYQYVMSNLIDLSEFMEDVPSEEEIAKKFADFNERLAAAGSDPGMQSGFVPGYAPAGMPTAGFAGGPAAQIPMNTPVSVPGFNTAGYQKPAVTEGNSDSYFNGATPSPSIQFKAGAPVSDDSAGDDLPF